MKRLTLGLAVAAGLTMAALTGAGSASATVLCEENNIPCPKGKVYAAGSTVSAALEPETSAVFKTTEGMVLNSCATSTFAGPTGNAGGKMQSVAGEFLKVTFGECSAATTVPEAGKFSIAYVAGENETRANLTVINTKITSTLFGVSCTYGAGGGILVGTMTSGKPALVHAKTIISKVAGGFLCPSTVKFEASYEMTAPYPVYFKEEEA